MNASRTSDRTNPVARSATKASRIKCQTESHRAARRTRATSSKVRPCPCIRLPAGPVLLTNPLRLGTKVAPRCASRVEPVVLRGREQRAVAAKYLTAERAHKCRERSSRSRSARPVEGPSVSGSPRARTNQRRVPDTCGDSSSSDGAGAFTSPPRSPARSPSPLTVKGTKRTSPLGHGDSPCGDQLKPYLLGKA